MAKSFKRKFMEIKEIIYATVPEIDASLSQTVDGNDSTGEDAPAGEEAAGGAQEAAAAGRAGRAGRAGSSRSLRGRRRFRRGRVGRARQKAYCPEDEGGEGR